MGEFDTDFGAYPVPIASQAFFLGMTVVVNIIMLNLLIALVSSAYESIMETQQEANDFERNTLILENSMFISEERKRQLCKDNERLIIAQKAVHTTEGQKE